MTRKVIQTTYSHNQATLLKMKRLTEAAYVIVNICIVLLMLGRSEGVPRNQIINQSCNNQIEHNQTVFVSNFIRTTEKLGNQSRSSLFATASTGSAPDANFGLFQCYGDLSTNDCIICYDSAHYVISGCFPNTGGIVYQDGCFMRFQNYSFYEEYEGPSDTSICGNITRKDSAFQGSARQAVSNAVRDALADDGYFAREELIMPGMVNESVYVLSNCWKTLSSNSCRACLEAASALLLQCLPWSEGRALMTGCFMRYSDTDFLNPEPVRSKNKGNDEFFFFQI